MGTLGPTMDIGASEHWGKMGIWGKCTPGRISTITANQQLGQMGILGPMDIGADGHGHCWGRGFRLEGVGDGGVGVGGVGIGGVGDGGGELG